MNQDTFGCVKNTIRLRSGLYFDLADPRPEQFTFADIAGALSKICRFGAQVERFYCPTPDQRVLTADLRWVPAGDLMPGTELLAFDAVAHELGMAGVLRRRFRPAAVIHNIPVRRAVWRLEMEDGSSVRSSAEHPWLVATMKSRNQKWVTTDEIARAVAAGSNRYMHRFFSPLESRTDYDAGWLAGMYDGEGYLSYVGRRGVQLGVSQRSGEILDHLAASLVAMGFINLGYSQTGERGSGVTTLNMKGGWRECARLLGTIRPRRLLAKFVSGLRDGAFGKQLDGKGSPLRIMRCHPEGEQWVAGIETTTRTYFCEGFGAHNSVAEHSYECAMQAKMDSLSIDIQRACLLHDAAEAFAGDVVKPLKCMLRDYGPIENRIEAVIAAKYGVTFDAPEVREIDWAMLIAERRALFSPDNVEWAGETQVRRLSIYFHGWNPSAAEDAFVAAAIGLGLEVAK